MAIQIENKPSLRYLKDIFLLPFDKNKPLDGYLLIPLIKDISNLISMVNENLMVSKTVKYKKLLRPMKYTDKIFVKNIKYHISSEEKQELLSFAKSMGMNFVDKVAAVKSKNVILDTSILHQYFLEYSAGKNYLLICKAYLNHLMYYINNTCKGLEQEHRYIMMDSVVWDISGISSAKLMSLNSKLLNPITMFYTLAKREPETLNVLEGYKFIIQDGSKGWFWFKGEDIKDPEFFQKLKVVLGKFKNAVTMHEGDESEEDEATKKAAAFSTAKMIQLDSDEKENENSEDEDDSDWEEDVVESEEEELARLSEEIKDNFREVSKTMPNNKRLEELRKKQAKVKLDNLTFADIEKNKDSDISIDSVDISDKVFTPNETAKKIRFDNFNKSYNEKQKEKDILSIFKSMNDKSLPVFVTSVKKVDTSTPMDLKETYTVTLEGADRIRHTLTFDLPKVYDENYIYIGGNRKEFVNQQILKPIVKISPDTVQICTNYNKIFMRRYGDENVSPEVQIFKKIILAHPEEFNVTMGNGHALSGKHKTSIEYDSLAKNFIKIELKKDKSKLIFNQEFFDKLIKDKKLKTIDEDWLYCFERNGNYIPFNTEEDISVCNETEEGSPDKPEMRLKATPISLFTTNYQTVTGKSFWDLEPDLKPGKKFMYSRCTVMAKKIPTVIFLSYLEGLTTVMRKAGVKNYFTDKRPKVDVLRQGVLQFSDGFLVYDRYPTKISMLMNGMHVVDTKAYSYNEFDEKAVYLDIFEALFNTRIIASGLDSFYDNMIDPVTKEILVEMDLPTDFVSLVLVANNLLSDNNYSSEISAENYRIRSNEMIYAYAYKTIANAYSNYKRKAQNKTPEKISIPRNEIIKQIITSNVMEDVSIINPITEKEKLHSMTCKGPSGINMERAYTKEKRCFDKTMTGFSAMSTSPDANCGVVREMTIEPKVMNTRGMIDVKKPLSEMKDVNIFSYGEMLTPLSVNIDDQIRVGLNSPFM